MFVALCSPKNSRLLSAIYEIVISYIIYIYNYIYKYNLIELHYIIILLYYISLYCIGLYQNIADTSMLCIPAESYHISEINPHVNRTISV